MSCKNRIIVLGSSGFVGSSVVNLLKNLSFSVISIDKKKINFLDNNSSILLKNIIKKDDIIINAIAIAPCKIFSDFLKNIVIINNIQNGLAGAKIKKYLNISSDAVYKDKKSKITENDIIQPSSLHGLMHYNREIIINTTLEKFVKIIHLRPTSIYGIDDPHSGYGPNLFFKNFMKKKDICIFGNGEELRDHIYINDVAKIISRIITTNISGPLNIVSGTGITFYQIAKIFKKLDHAVVIKKIKRQQGVPHGGYRLFDNSKFRKYFPGYIINSIELNIFEMIKNNNARN
jgi:UDP-glucose 4-epimerase